MRVDTEAIAGLPCLEEALDCFRDAGLLQFVTDKDRFRRPGGQGLKAGEEIFTRGSCAWGSPGRTISPKESAL